MFYLINLSLVSNNFSILDLHVFSHGFVFTSFLDESVKEVANQVQKVTKEERQQLK